MQYINTSTYFRPAESDLNRFGLNWGAVWAKMGSSWACVFIYMWTLFLPHCWLGRDPRFSRPRSRDAEEVQELNHAGEEVVMARESSL